MPTQRIHASKWLLTFAVPCTLLGSQLSAQSLEWVEPALSVRPEARCCASAVYDSALHATVLFGGSTYSTIFNDTWIFSKTSGWKQLKPLVSPPPLTGAFMAYDPTTRTVVLFGGNESGTSSGETWTFDGVTWTQQFPAISPSPRESNTNGMVFDSAIGKVVLFGGWQYGPSDPLSDTWEWDGLSKTWEQKFPGRTPSPRETTLAYDATSGQVLLFGGATTGYVYYGDTWTYDGVNWHHRLPATTPPARTDHALIFDPEIGKVVMFGGLAGPCEDCGETRLNDTWVWDGSDWTLEQIPVSPGSRSGTAFDYDETVNGVLLFGGWVSDSEFTNTNWFLGLLKP